MQQQQHQQLVQHMQMSFHVSEQKTTMCPCKPAAYESAQEEKIHLTCI